MIEMRHSPKHATAMLSIIVILWIALATGNHRLQALSRGPWSFQACGKGAFSVLRSDWSRGLFRVKIRGFGFNDVALNISEVSQG
jgi:hypothetical protein